MADAGSNLGKLTPKYDFSQYRYREIASRSLTMQDGTEAEHRNKLQIGEVKYDALPTENPPHQKTYLVFVRNVFVRYMVWKYFNFKLGILVSL